MGAGVAETARLATDADVADLSELWAHAVAELDGQRGGGLLAGSLTRPDLAGFLRDAVADPLRAVALGLVDGSPVGIASVVADASRRQAIGSLELIYVEPGARQVGVAEAMLGVVVDWCATRGLAGLDAPALPGNRAAKAFFESHGFLARLLVMHRGLGRG